MNPIAWWFCCLNPTERAIILATEDGFLATLFQGVPVTVWNAFWLPFGGAPGPRSAAFLSIYGLEVATTEEDGVPLEVVRPKSDRLGQWLLWELYLETPAAACVDGCGQSKLPWQD